MARETNQTQAPLLCTTGCGFYGSARHNGMCSVCYRDSLQRRNAGGRVTPPELSSADVPESLQRTDCSTAASPEPASRPDPEPTQHSDATSSSPIPEVQSALGAEGSLRTDDLESTAGGSEQRDEGSASCSSGSGSQSSGLERSSRSSKRKLKKKAGGSEQREESSAAGSSGLERSSKKKLKKTTQSVDGEKASEDSAQPDDAQKPKAKKSRCFTCHKKTGLTGFDCRCGNMFCSTHRYSDMHNCTFDYRADAAARIRRENPVVVGEKVPKI